MTCTGSVDIHADSGYRRLDGSADDQAKGYGMCGLTMMRRGESTTDGSPVVHLLESICKSHKLMIRSSYGAETFAAAHGVDDVCTTLSTLHELANWVMTPTELKQIREVGGLYRHSHHIDD